MILDLGLAATRPQYEEAIEKHRMMGRWVALNPGKTMSDFAALLDAIDKVVNSMCDGGFFVSSKTTPNNMGGDIVIDLFYNHVADAVVLQMLVAGGFASMPGDAGPYNASINTGN